MTTQKIREFEAWLSGAARGDEYVYYTGDVIPEFEAEIRQRVRRAYDEGEVELCQRRISGGDSHDRCGVLAFVAQRRTRKLPVPASCLAGRATI